MKDQKDLKEQKEEEIKDVKKVEKKNEDYYVYKLVGIVVHNGNASSGHYYSYINTNRTPCEDSENYLKTENDRWVEFNDSTVREFDFKKVPSECFGGNTEDTMMMQDIGDAHSRSKSAYMLVYERKLKTWIPELVLNQEQIQKDDIVLSSLECDGTAVSRAENKTAQKCYYKDPNTNELFLLHNFHYVPQFITEPVINVR